MTTPRADFDLLLLLIKHRKWKNGYLKQLAEAMIKEHSLPIKFTDYNNKEELIADLYKKETK